LGYPERATARSRESLAVARDVGAISADLTAALVWSAFLNLLLRNWKTASSHTDEASRLAHEHGFMALLGISGFEHGWALAQFGQIDDGLSEMLKFRNELMQAAGTVTAPWFFVGLADVYLVHRAHGGRWSLMRTSTRRLIR
jgi:hypothetical protein